MYKAKLSYGQLSEYIPLLIEKGFLENLTVIRHRQEQHLLKTTEQGELIALIKNNNFKELTNR